MEFSAVFSMKAEGVFASNAEVRTLAAIVPYFLRIAMV
ncbi:hypothetical protein C7S16_4782 [Burkholderia thailandensis]|uniref:Uncharacterized protein n=1 Tax=Burkholderia thailandensis TaxID=57975 RepID=A0AAW9CWF1_BURTH|nr:hypothetical protein [Burkholderia thailandensis]MDW9252099.1 hypothetical protein [Burkholderia thailandensis]